MQEQAQRVREQLVQVRVEQVLLAVVGQQEVLVQESHQSLRLSQSRMIVKLKMKPKRRLQNRRGRVKSPQIQLQKRLMETLTTARMTRAKRPKRRRRKRTRIRMKQLL
ncbi:hypothetical protein C483_17353 [Natrialba hulunbeirensis JCM 10989]|uniref:Uncharacterized protein n=1 Tax=Natrialba hulunbeirensis JCM 10989 TaxID=1227493 RepID=L9ZRA8_9EURY|nr:hypothetical protein C483_17353 [Natrialba hulunbeirensis JCM 10989]